jgi:hypothetical protein
MSKILNYVTLIILLMIIGTQAYNLFYTRNDSFSGAWIVRATISILIVSFLISFMFSAFFHRFSIDQLPPCTSINYFRFRWYVFQMAAIGLSAIPVYLAIFQRTKQNRLLILLASQIQVNLFTVLLCIGFDSLTRYFYKKQQQSPAEQAQQQPPSSAPIDQTAQFGYFSPKTKGQTPSTSQKSPFEGSKFRYAR